MGIVLHGGVQWVDLAAARKEGPQHMPDAPKTHGQAVAQIIETNARKRAQAQFGAMELSGACSTLNVGLASALDFMAERHGPGMVQDFLAQLPQEWLLPIEGGA